ncbi:MAG: hypothetical protein ACOC8F_03250 [Planctomycetota bacterium]
MPVTVLLAAMLQAGEPDKAPLREDDPPVEPPSAGVLRGTLRPGEQVATLTAVNRQTQRTFKPDAFDRETGAFRFADVPGAGAYDLCLELRDGRRIEGVDLRFVDAELLELARVRRKQLDLPITPPERFARRDARALLDYAAAHEDFMDIKRPLYVRGWGKRAVMLVELLRTRAFYDAGGDLVWRVELWYFERRGGGWVRLANQERVLRRRRIQPPAWRKIDLTYYPSLSVHVARDGSSEPVTFDIPDASDPSRGRASGTEPKLKTEPHLLGMDAPAATSRPATRPADEE